MQMCLTEFKGAKSLFQIKHISHQGFYKAYTYNLRIKVLFYSEFFSAHKCSIKIFSLAGFIKKRPQIFYAAFKPLAILLQGFFESQILNAK